MEIHRRPTDVADAAREVATLLRPRLEGKRQRLELDCPAVPLALADPTRVRQILTNLVTNAHLYTEHGGSIGIAVGATAHHVVIAISDDGRGMTEEEVEHAFDRFYRGRSEAEAGGTGLGLAIVRSLVELHGGDIRVRSAEGEGTTFTVRLPRALEAGEAGPAPRHALHGRRVLVVDDEPEIAALIAERLAPFEVEAVVAESGRAALERLRAEHFDAVTLDILMPGMSGFEVLRTLRADPELRGIPVVVVSVFSGREALAGEWVVAQADRRGRARRRAGAGDPGRPRASGRRRPARAARDARADARGPGDRARVGHRRARRHRAVPRALLRGGPDRRRPPRPGVRRCGRWISAAGGCGARSSSSPTGIAAPGSPGSTPNRCRSPTQGRRYWGCCGPSRSRFRGGLESADELEMLKGALEARAEQAVEKERQLERYAADLRETFKQERARAQQLRRSYVATVRALANAVEARDAYTGKHAERVAAYGLATARAGGLSLAEDSRDRVRLPPARRRQGRGARRDPLQARAADRCRARGHGAPHGHRLGDPSRDRLPRGGQAGRALTTTSAGTAAATRTGSPGRTSCPPLACSRSPTPSTP